MGKQSLTYKKATAIAIWIIINSVFVFKYSYRLSLPVATVCTLAYATAYCLPVWLCGKRHLALPEKVWYVLMGGITITSAILFNYIPVESIRVDRWEMIQIFWDSVHNGAYPYAAHSPGGNYPGPMPVYFLIAYPFYLIQEIGWLGVAAAWLTFVYIKRRQLKQEQYTFIMLMTMLSVTSYYEIATRSTILLNTIIFVFYYSGLKNLHKYSTARFYGYALLGGIIFSTRNVFAIPLILWGMNALVSGEIAFGRLLKWSLCFLLAFAFTFLPFFVAAPELFLRYNPFVVQGDAILPFAHIVAFVALAFILPLQLKKRTDTVFLSIIMFFAIITYHIFYAIADIGIDAYLRGGADISYYIFCIPFIIELLAQKEYDKQ